MEASELQCFYKDCKKIFQSKTFLVTHVNTCHLEVGLYKCPCCEILFTSIEKYFSHRQKKNLRVSTSYSNEKFTLKDLYCDTKIEHNPPNIIKLPVLPSIDKDRAYLAYSYKLPITARLYDLLQPSRPLKGE